MRQSAVTARVASGNEVTEGFNRVMDSMFDRDASALVRKALNSSLGTLTDEERFFFGTQIFTVYCHLETVYFQTQSGLTDPYVDYRMRAMVSWFQNTPGVREWWYGNVYDDRPGAIREMYSEEFRDFVQRHEVSQPTLSPAEV